MRIAHNIMAMNADRVLKTTTLAMQKSLEKLSSGYRINRAADDAAGLSVSEGMRAQISGMKQAVKNAQDGISLVQTVEGTLDEIHTMLRRISDLAEQAANDIYTAAQRRQIQIEVNRLVEEVDRVVEASNFNNLRLLKGTFSGATIRVLDAITQQRAVAGESAFVGQYIIAKMTEAGFGQAADGTKDVGDLTTGSARIIANQWIQFQYNLSRGLRDTALLLAASNLGLNAVPTDSTTANSDMQALYNQFGYIERYRAEALAILNRFSSGYSSAMGNLSGTDTPTAIETNLQFTQRTGAQIGLSYTNLSGIGGPLTIADVDNLNRQAITSALGLTRAEATNISVGGSLVLHVGGNPASYADVISGAVSNAIQETAHGANVLNFKISQMSSFVIGKVYASLLLAEGNQNLAAVTSMSDPAVGQRGTGSVLTLRGLWINLDDPQMVSFSSRGVLTQLAAEDAITVARKAIDDVSDLRADLGAFQNRLESTVRNLNNQIENLQASESRIRDVDFAEEMIEFTRTQILLQSGTAMLAQANQVPQTVLALLR
ncbi:MAG: flagellin N-terminal helical domain-containing protein [bacterium]